MNKQILTGLLGILFFSTSLFAVYGGGSGTAESPYEIWTPEQMNTIGVNSGDWDKHFKLMADIDMSIYTGTQYNMIGGWPTRFTGTFDGCGHVIRNLTYTTPVLYERIGLFSRIGNASIQNLGLENIAFTSSECNSIGALVGYNESGFISNCYVTGSVSGRIYVGGLVGNNGGTLSDCYMTGSITGQSTVGGLVGYNSGSITNCYTTGSVSVEYSSDSGAVASVGGLAGNNAGSVTACYSTSPVTGNGINLGGLVGNNQWGSLTGCYATGSVNGSGDNFGGLVGLNTALLTACYATGTVNGTNSVGGLIGSNRNDGSLACCYSTGLVSGSSDVGGLVGNSTGRSIASSFWDIQTSGQTTSDGGTGKTTAQMQTLSTFTDAGWDYIDESTDGLHDYWQMKINDYPQLTHHTWTLDGEGTAVDPYIIANPSHLGKVWLRPFSDYRLASDLDLSGISWSSAVIPYFRGSFEGQRFVISDLTINQPDLDFVGFFGVLRAFAQIQNLVVEYVNITGNSFVGGLCGISKQNTISNCYVAGLVSGNSYVGGLVGDNTECSIIQCFTTGAVSGDSYIGGLMGKYFMDGIGEVTSCYAINSVNGNSYVGGLVGYNYVFSGQPSSCYATGSVSGNTYVGGLVGYNNASLPTSCFWDIETSGQTTSAGGTGKTTAEMQAESTFTSVGWDFENTWRMSGYPVLQWEVRPHQPYIYGAIEYEITDLGTIGGLAARADAINDRGQVVGEGFFYDGKTFQDTYRLNGNYTDVGGLNNLGHLAGIIAHYQNNQWLWYAMVMEGTTIHTIWDTIQGWTSAAEAINDSGQIAGNSWFDSGQHAFLYDDDSGVQYLSPIGGFQSTAWDINNNGQIVGRIETAEGPSRAFLYDGTTMHDLGTLGGDHSDAFGINDNGQVVGEAYTANVKSHAFFYDGTTMHDLGTLAGPSGWSAAQGINNSGQVVGHSWIPEELNVTHAFLYDDTTGMIDLNDLLPPGSGWVLNVANDINSSGQIVGSGTFEGQTHAYMLTPVSQLQAEINAAQDGDVIVVQPGVYPGRLHFKGKNITLTSTDPTNPEIVARTVLDGLGLSTVITFDGTEDETCILSGFTITGGSTPDRGGGICGNNCSATVRNCVFRGNTAANKTGGGIWGIAGAISNCIFENNHANYGGALAKCSGIIANCLFINNTVDTDGAALNNCDGTIVNCTFVNHTQPAPSMILQSDGVIKNSIIRSTSGTAFSNSTAITQYCCYSGGAGEGDIDTDPLFIDPANGNYHLLPDSACIDSGDPASDFSNEPWPNGDRINMGVYGNTTEATQSRDGLISLGFETINKIRIGRTVFEYELAVIMHNTNDHGMNDVQLKLVDMDEAVISVSDDLVTMSSIAPDEIQTSQDTFSLTIDRSQPIATGKLTWELNYYITDPSDPMPASQLTMPLSAIDSVPGDITGEGHVNLEDFAALSRQWQDVPGEPSADIALPMDNYVGIEDLLYLAENWLQGVPE